MARADSPGQSLRLGPLVARLVRRRARDLCPRGLVEGPFGVSCTRRDTLARDGSCPERRRAARSSRVPITGLALLIDQSSMGKAGRAGSQHGDPRTSVQ